MMAKERSGLAIGLNRGHVCNVLLLDFLLRSKEPASKYKYSRGQIYRAQQPLQFIEIETTQNSNNHTDRKYYRL